MSDAPTRTTWPTAKLLQGAADDPGAAPCPHGVELDMCDTRECAHTLNQITKEN